MGMSQQLVDKHFLRFFQESLTVNFWSVTCNVGAICINRMNKENHAESRFRVLRTRLCIYTDCVPNFIRLVHEHVA